MDWDSAIEDIGPSLFRYFRFRFNEEQADDLTQETLIRLVKKVDSGSFDPQLGTLKMLAFGIAHYVALEQKRTPVLEALEAADEVAAFGAASDDNIDELLDRAALISRLKREICNLSEDEAAIISLMIDKEITLSEIGMILGIPEGTVKSHIFRAKKRLAAWMTRRP